jgi:hypothetical protein
MKYSGKKEFLLIFTFNWYTPAEQPAPNPTEADKILSMMNRPSSHQNRQIRLNRNQKILFKNQRPPAEVAPTPSRGHPHTLSSAGGR